MMKKRPVVCMDEKPIQFLAEAREGITSKTQEYAIKTTNMSAMAHAVSFCLLSHLQVGVMLKPKSREQGLIWLKASNVFSMSNIRMRNRLF